MKRIFTSPHLIEVSQLKDLMERAGIDCIIHNDLTHGYVAEGGLGFGHHELWVPDEEWSEAAEVKSDWASLRDESSTP